MRPAKPVRHTGRAGGPCVHSRAAEVARSQKAPSTGKLSKRPDSTWGRIVIVPREFAPIPYPPLPLPQVPGTSRFRECVWGGMRNLSVRWDGQNPSPISSAVLCCLPLVGPVLWGSPQELMMRYFSRLLSFADLVQNARALGMRLFWHGGGYRSDVSSHLINLGRGTASRSGPSQAIGRAGRNTPCPSSAMSSGRLFLDRVGRHQSPSPLHRHSQITMHSRRAQAQGDILTLQRRGHFYFALTPAPFTC
jgi:hypothetical protein